MSARIRGIPEESSMRVKQEVPGSRVRQICCSHARYLQTNTAKTPQSTRHFENASTRPDFATVHDPAGFQSTRHTAYVRECRCGVCPAQAVPDESRKCCKALAVFAAR